MQFQCGTFFRHSDYLILREYAHVAERVNLPKLGWIQDAIVREPSYVDFLAWFRKAKGWPA